MFIVTFLLKIKQHEGKIQWENDHFLSGKLLKNWNRFYISRSILKSTIFKKLKLKSREKTYFLKKVKNSRTIFLLFGKYTIYIYQKITCHAWNTRNIWEKIISKDNASVMLCALLIFLNHQAIFSFIKIPAKTPAVLFGASSMTIKMQLQIFKMLTVMSLFRATNTYVPEVSMTVTPLWGNRACLQEFHLLYQEGESGNDFCL